MSTVEARKNPPSFESMGLDPSDPMQVAAYTIGLDLFVKGKIVEFDPTIILVIIEILSQILPILQEYCPQDPAEISEAARSLGFFQRLRWISIIHSRTIRTVGRRAWRDVGAADFAGKVIDLAGEDTDLLGQVMMAC